MFTVLTQLKIAPTIVAATYIALIGTPALTPALVLGLGGREIVADILRTAYSSAQDSKDQVSQGIQTGRDPAQQHGDEIRTQAPGRKLPSTGAYQAS